MIPLAVKTKFAQLIEQFKKLQGSPTYLARGVTIGVLIGIAPIMPFKSLSIITLTIILRGSTVASFLICTAICNPFTYIPLYYLAWLVGDYLLPGKSSWTLLKTTIATIQHSGLSESLTLLGQIGFDTTVVLLTGGLVLALPPALLSYPLACKLFKKLANRRQQSTTPRHKNRNN